MKLLLCIVCLGAFSVSAQTWRTVTNADLGFGHAVSLVATSSGKRFNINRVDNMIWSSFGDRVIQIDSSGNVTVHRYETDDELPSQGKFGMYAFMPNEVYMADFYTGRIYRYDGVNWHTETFTTDAHYISVDGDTLWACDNPVVTVEAGANFTHMYGADRLESRNGYAYSSSGFGCGYFDTYLRKYYRDALFEYFDADTTPFLLDNTNHDFKFANNSDSLFTAGDLGFSIALNHVFVDTITTHNTTNMPSGKIVEFEFDANNNIWALFGDDLENVQTIAFLDRSTNDWSMHYNTGNSPIDFSEAMSIELDSHGNPYIMQGVQFHVLDLHNAPAWLGNDEKNSNLFSVYPNPVNDFLQVRSSSFGEKDIVITDGLGRKVLQSVMTNGNIELDVTALQSGVYFLKGMSENEVVTFIKK